jgi:photosystem II stability/assembly factor-like uncharacterized protein
MKTLTRFLLVLLICSPQLLSQWTSQTSPTTAYLIDIQFIGKQVGCIVGQGVVLRTTDGGATWPMLALKGLNPYKLKLLSSSLGWLVGGTSSSRSLIMKTTDGGASWAVQDSSYQGSYFDGVFFIDALHGWVVGGSIIDTSGRICRSTDGGNSWIQAGTPNIAEPNDVFFLDTLRGFAVGQMGAIVKTTDGGVTWREVYRAWYSYTTGASTTEPLRRVFFATPDSGWAIGGISGIETKVRTTDGGVTWQTANLVFGSSLHGLCFTDSKNGWTVGGSNAGLVIERTTDGGVTWAKQKQPFAPSALSYFESITMTSLNEGWVVGDKGTILKTINGGADPATEVEGGTLVLPTRFDLSQNYPNPFNPSTAISYQLTTTSFVTLRVFDVLGREVATLINDSRPPGTYIVQFDASGLPSGIYVYRLQAGNFISAKKMVLMK